MRVSGFSCQGASFKLSSTCLSQSASSSGIILGVLEYSSSEASKFLQGLPWISMDSMVPWMFTDSMDFNGSPWIPWLSLDSIALHCIVWYCIELKDS